MQGYFVEFDSLRWEAEGRMQPGGTFPETSFAALSPQNASISRSDESVELTSAQGDLGMMGAASQVRRVSGPMGGGGRQDA